MHDGNDRDDDPWGRDDDPWGAELSETLWVPGVDYIKEWSEALSAAEEFRDLLISRGLPASHIQAGARTGASGGGSVRLIVSLDATRFLIHVLGRADWAALCREMGCDGQELQSDG
jgi:hypothetical protein